MAGRHSAGIVRKVQSYTYTHCSGHALNLAASDTVKMNGILRNTLDCILHIECAWSRHVSKQQCKK